MPTYEYKCKEHGHIFEVEQKMSDEPLTKCQICDSEVERLIGMPTIFCKDSPSSRYKKDFRSDPHKWASVCESAFGASPKEQADIKKNWNKKPLREV
jgi:putative FmdB family regulatory protein